MAASPSNLSSLSWEKFLPNHGVFKALGDVVQLPSEQPYLGRNILVEKDGDLFLWDDGKKHILVANLRNLKAKNERSSRLQTLLCTNPPSFSVSKMVFSKSGTYLALVGSHGVCVVEMPQKRGKFTEFEHGKDTINCRTVHVDDHFFTCHQTVSIFEAKWFPGSSSDVHLVVLTSDNRIRLYDITEPQSPQNVITVGSVPPDQSLCLPSTATFAEAFGEVVVAFDFAPVIEVKLGPFQSDEISYPVFLLQENGDVLYMILMLTSTGFYYELHGYLSIFPPAEDNYGIDSCSIMCFQTNPVVVAIATCSGTIYHSITLDVEENEIDVFNKSTESEADISKDERHIACLAPKISLYVYECIELSLAPSSDLETTFDQSGRTSPDKKEEYHAVKLFPDPLSQSRYHCYHSTGVYTVTLPWLKNLQQFCSETGQVATFDPNTHGNVQHLICTNPVATSLVNLTGFTVVDDWDLGATIIALTNKMECITKPLRFLNRFHSPIQSSSVLDVDTDNQTARSQPAKHRAGEFENRIQQILRRDSSHPLVRSGFEGAFQLSQKECFQFLSGATETFRLEYVNKFALAKEEIDRRVELLAEQSRKQMDDLGSIEDDKGLLQDHLRLLAEKYEDAKDRQELLLKRIHKVLELIQSRQPILSDAEIKMREELNEMSRNIQIFKKSFDQLQHKRRYLGNKQDTSAKTKDRTLSETHKKQLKFLLKKEGDVIEDLVGQVNHLKLQVGF